ncbi:MAG: radical SAM protein, partial [Erysipelotrichaceae bacterium]|nr:radical SAM protein [Erysipelotrichaceae bacterium]
NVCRNYGRLTSLAIDPIEKKPLAGFYPGSYILSAGSFGCNLFCPFCQNYEISRYDDVRTVKFMPEDLLDAAAEHPESIGIAFTYNEPLISWEFILDTAKLFR